MFYGEEEIRACACSNCWVDGACLLGTAVLDSYKSLLKQDFSTNNTNKNK